MYGRVVVSSSVPNIKANPAYVKLEKKIRTVYKGNIKISKVQFNEKKIRSWHKSRNSIWYKE